MVPERPFQEEQDKELEGDYLKQHYQHDEINLSNQCFLELLVYDLSKDCVKKNQDLESLTIRNLKY
jgi:hypothetical protein